MSRSAEELEREVEKTRNHMESTVDALGDKLSPGQLLDEVVRGLRGSGRSGTLASVGRQVREQPVPLALLGVGLVWVGAGLVWLAMSSRTRRQGYVVYGGYADYRKTVHQPVADRYPVAGGPSPDRGGLP